MDRNEEIKKISELLYNEYISNGWKNVSTESCKRQAINYIDVRDLVKKLTLTDVGNCPFEAYAVFCIECDRKGIKPIKHKDYLNLG